MENKSLPLGMPECSFSSRKAQHPDELRVSICPALPGSCAAHAWMTTTKGHLVLLQGTLHSLVSEPGRELDRHLQGEGQDRLSSLFPTEETATATLEIQVRNLSGENTAPSAFLPAMLGDVTCQQSS